MSPLSSSRYKQRFKAAASRSAFFLFASASSCGISSCSLSSAVSSNTFRTAWLAAASAAASCFTENLLECCETPLKMEVTEPDLQMLELKREPASGQSCSSPSGSSPSSQFVALDTMNLETSTHRSTF